MSLQKNKKSKKINPNSLKKYFVEFMARILVLVTLYFVHNGNTSSKSNLFLSNSSNNAIISQTYERKYLNSVVEIPEFYKKQIFEVCDKFPFQKIRIKDLLKIDRFTCLVGGEAPLDFLEYCENIEFLSLHIETSNTSILKNIKELDYVKEIDLILSDNYTSNETTMPTLNSIDFKFLNRCPKLEKLIIDGLAVEPDVIEKVTSLKTLSIKTDGNYKLNFSELTFLDNLIFLDEGAYTIVDDFTLEEYERLINAGVNIEFAKEENLETFLKVNKQLDLIVDNLSLTSENTDKEKFDKILVYILEKLKYDPKIYNMIKNKEKVSGKSSEFYQGGMLYGALEKDTAICGNYASLFEALASRTYLSTYLLKSTNHAWNIVEIEGKLYYVDLTMLDITDFRVVGEEYWNGEMRKAWAFYPASQAILEGNTKYLEWYMENPQKYGINDDSITHDAINMPTYINKKLTKKLIPKDN